MHPYDKILSRDEREFPLKLFEAYPRFFAVDWRAGEDEILEGFEKAAGITKPILLERDAASGALILVNDGFRLEVRFPENVSSQHCMVKVLQSQFGIRHSIRYLNHVAYGDTAYFVVESMSAWDRLTAANPHVKWFFTPVDKLPDFINAPFEEVAKAGKEYAEGSG